MADGIRIEVKGLKEVTRQFDLLRKNAPKLASKAINAAALTARDALIGSTFGAFDKPTPFTIKSFTVGLSTPAKLEASAGLKEYSTKTGGVRPHYLQPHVFGGGRPQKLSEQRLGGYYVPGAAAKLNRYGNISELQKILSGLGIRIDQLQSTDLVRTANTRRGSRPGQRNRRLYWLGRVGKKQTLGVWAVGEGRRNERLRPVLIFPDQGRKIPKYSKRWPFYDIAKKEFARNIPRFVAKYYDQWLKGM